MASWKPSPRNPRNLQTRRRDHLAHHFVHAAAERDDEVSLGLLIQPEQQVGGIGSAGLPYLPTISSASRPTN